MIALFCLVLLGETHEIEPIEYRMIPSTLVYDEDINAEDDWFGLFDAACGSMLRPVEFELILEDIVVYEGERPAGWMLEFPGETQEPLFMVTSSMQVFTAGPVPTAIHEYVPLNSDMSISINVEGMVEARLFTTEEGLFLESCGLCQHITDTYPGEESFGNHIAIVWAGDLDRDGRIDLLIDDVYDSYYLFDYCLFLSTEAGPDYLVNKVSRFYDVYY